MGRHARNSRAATVTRANVGQATAVVTSDIWFGLKIELYIRQLYWSTFVMSEHLIKIQGYLRQPRQSTPEVDWKAYCNSDS